MKILLLLLLAASANATTTTQPCDYARTVYEDLRLKASPLVFTKNGDICTVEYTLKPGQSYVLDDRQARRDILKLRLVELLVKFRTDPASITAAEQREATFKLIAFALSQE